MGREFWGIMGPDPADAYDDGEGCPDCGAERLREWWSAARWRDYCPACDGDDEPDDERDDKREPPDDLDDDPPEAP